MMKSLVLAFLLSFSLNDNIRGGGVTSVDAFLSSPSSPCRACPSSSNPVFGPIPKDCSSSRLQFFWGYEMGGTDAVNEKKNKDETSDESQDVLFFASLVTKAIIILIIKTAKDIVNYPPNLLDQFNRYQQVQNTGLVMSAAECIEQEEEECVIASTEPTMVAASSQTELPFELTKTNPFILLAKFLGVLTYKSMHDAIYYPALWIHDLLYPPRNDDDYYYYY